MLACRKSYILLLALTHKVTLAGTYTSWVHPGELVQVQHCYRFPFAIARELLMTHLLLPGTYLFLDAKIDETVEYIKKCAVRARSSPRNAFRISEYVAGAIEQFTPPGAGWLVCVTANRVQQSFVIRK